MPDKSGAFRNSDFGFRTENAFPQSEFRKSEFRNPLSCLIIPADSEAAVDFTNYVVSILISLILGLLGFLVAYKLFDWLTPGVNFSDQLNADNRAVAIFLAGLFIGLGLLLGNAIK